MYDPGFPYNNVEGVSTEILELADKMEKEISSDNGEQGTVFLCCGEIGTA